MTERDALAVAAWLAGVAFVACVSAGVLTRSSVVQSRRVRWWVVACVIVFSLAFFLFGFIAFTFVLFG